jgi:RHS repeat-associated protein
VAGVTLPGGQSAATNVTINYTYDPLYRLTAADYSDGKYFHYAYDAVGNRLIQDANPSGQPASTSYTYDSANRLTSVGGVTYTWDANGNLKNDGTNAYTYDSANRLTAVNGGQNAISYKYDGLGNRLQQTANGTTITYMNDLNVGLTQVLSDGTNTYLYGNDRIAQSPITNSQSTIQYFLGDALGSVRQMVDESGAVVYTASYDPYGEVLSTAGEAQTSYGYSGEETDSYIKLIDLRSRMYSPETGRFLTQDTWQGDYERPQSLNEWDYTSNNPINNIDPTGHCIGPNGVNLPDGSTACASTTATVYPPVFYRGYSQDKLLSYWQTQEPGYPTGCGPFAIAIAANLYNSSYKGSNYKGADIEAFLEETGSKIRGLGMPSWLNFGGSLGYYAHGWVDYKSNASVEDLELAIENNKLPVVAVSWQSSDTINKLFWQDMCPNGKFNIFHKPDFGNITVGHYMVAVGFDPQKDQIIFLDPGIRVKQLHYYSYQEFNNDWNGTSNQFIQVGSMWTIFP